MMNISLNMLFWSIIITAFYFYVLLTVIRQNKPDKYKQALLPLTIFYIAIMLSIWIVYPEGWF